MEDYVRLDYDMFQRFAQELGNIAKNYDPFVLITVYYLTTARNMKPREVAEVLGLTRGTVTVYKSLVRRALRRILNGESAEKQRKAEKTAKSTDKATKQKAGDLLLLLLKKPERKMGGTHG